MIFIVFVLVCVSVYDSGVCFILNEDICSYDVRDPNTFHPLEATCKYAGPGLYQLLGPEWLKTLNMDRLTTLSHLRTEMTLDVIRIQTGDQEICNFISAPRAKKILVGGKPCTTIETTIPATEDIAYDSKTSTEDETVKPTSIRSVSDDINIEKRTMNLPKWTTNDINLEKSTREDETSSSVDFTRDVNRVKMTTEYKDDYTVEWVVGSLTTITVILIVIVCKKCLCRRGGRSEDVEMGFDTIPMQVVPSHSSYVRHDTKND